MGHLTVRNYQSLRKRLDRFVYGMPHSEALYEILKILYTDEEARLCSILPLKDSTVEQISAIWKKPVEECQAILKELCLKGLVFEFSFGSQIVYMLAPAVLGFFEFTLMRLDDRYDRKALSELFHRYINVEGEFIKEFLAADPPISRALVQEQAVEEYYSEILPYEGASQIIDNAFCITVGTCFCRHKMEHMGMACDNPQDVCLTFDHVADHLARHGIARRIERNEARGVLDLCVDRGLVQIADNKKNGCAIMCNCCGCCCDVLLGYKRYGWSIGINPSNFICRIDEARCSDCGTCIEHCPVNVIQRRDGAIVVNERRCLGCGVCTRYCPTEACHLEARPNRPFVPETFVDKTFLGALRNGRIGNLVFDTPSGVGQTFLRDLLNAFTGLKPVKALLRRHDISNKIFQWATRTK